MPAPPGPLSYLTDDVSNKDQTKWEKLSTCWSAQGFKKNFLIIGFWVLCNGDLILGIRLKWHFLLPLQVWNKRIVGSSVSDRKRERETAEWTPSPWSQTVLWEETGQRSSVCVQLCVCVCVLGEGSSSPFNTVTLFKFYHISSLY